MLPPKLFGKYPEGVLPGVLVARSARIRAHLSPPGGSRNLDSAPIPSFQTVSRRTILRTSDLRASYRVSWWHEVPGLGLICPHLAALGTSIRRPFRVSRQSLEGQFCELPI